MKLVQKNSEVKLDSFSGHVAVKMKWTSAVDFDLAALFVKKNGDEGLVYFGSTGSLDSFPFIKLDKDAGVGDQGGDNEENLTIAKIDDFSKVHLVAWDYKAVQKGKHARFDNSDIKLHLDDGKDISHEVHLHTGDMGNTIIIATIDNSGDQPKLINTSKVGTLKNLNDSADILAIANS